jgi:hypothetical protein
MRILVLESEPGLADRAISELEHHHCEVVRCHERGAEPFPCLGIIDRCPLVVAPVDAALVVRHGEIDPTPYEDGAGCAIRHNVPLVVAAACEHHPYRPWSLGEADRDTEGSVFAACAEAVDAGSPLHEQVADEALREALDAAGFGGAVGWVEVKRSAPDLRATVHLSVRLGPQLAEWIATRVHAALRSYDRDAQRIDVTLSQSGAVAQTA